MSIYKGTELLAGVATNTIENAHELFDFIWSDHIKNSMSWLRAGTFSWQDGNLYVAAYNHLVADYSGGTSQTETVGSYTITYVLADDGHKITADETTVANIYAESGVAWYYILDTVNTRFKLPRTKFGFTGLRDTVGKYVPESLPNITGWTDNFIRASRQHSGCFSSEVSGTINMAGGNSAGWARDYFNASASSSTYQNNAPVQQRATQMYLYFYVGQFSQSATEQTAGLNSSLFNGKVDLDAANLSTQGKSLISGLGMPSDTYDELTVGASGTEYAAPANGWFFIKSQVVGKSSGYTGHLDSKIMRIPLGAYSNFYGGGCIPVSTGDTVTLIYESNVTIVSFRFYYAKGEA